MIQTLAAHKKRAKGGWFDRVFTSRITFPGQFVQLYLAPAQGAAGIFGVSVAKRVCPHAVERNYAKRVVRAWYSQWYGQLSHVDVVIRIKRPYDRRHCNDVRQELGRLLTRSGRWRASLS